MRRSEIADRLRAPMPSEYDAQDRAIHNDLANRVERGESANAILQRGELDVYPDTYSWLSSVLSDDNDVDYPD